MSKETLTITDNRTGKSIEVPIEHGSIRATELEQLGLKSYDPAFMNTACTKSTVTFIDGKNGILRYRGYPIEELAEKAPYLEVCSLLLNGELPSKKELSDFENEIKMHTLVHENIRELMDGFRYDAHPMGMLISTVSALSTFYPEAKNVNDAANRRLQIVRLIAKMPTLAAYAYRHRRGLPYVYPDNDLSYAGNFLNMMFKMTEPKYKPNPAVEKALDVLFTLHADHEQNCSANAMRSVGSSKVDPYSALAAACAALYGPLHGGANEAVVKMLQQIGSKENIPEFLNKVRNKEALLMGFGHRIYESYDPRAKVIKRLADEVFSALGKNPLIDIALEMERIALSDDYFVKRNLYPNVDFYSGLIYQAMDIPMDMYPVLFAIGRTVGWLSQWEEMLTDKEQKIARPLQLFLGKDKRPYVEASKR